MSKDEKIDEKNLKPKTIKPSKQKSEKIIIFNSDGTINQVEKENK